MTSTGYQPSPTVSVAAPPTLPPPADDGILDFSPPPAELQPKRFRIGPQDDDVFTAAASIPVLISADFTKAMAALRSGDVDEASSALDGILGLFRQVLYPEDVERFLDRCRDIKRPVDHRTLMRVMDGLLEEWGLRPQPPPEDSSGGPSDQAPGISSPAAPAAEGSTSEPSPSTSSSISSTPNSPTPPTG